MKISGIYKITNTITGDFYVGSSKDVKLRWMQHEYSSTWNQHPNNQMYLDMKKFGVDKFSFEILAEAEPEQLKEVEQQFIEKLQPTYNNINSKGLDIERLKKYQKEYGKEYRKTDKSKEYQKQYHKSDKCKEYQKEYKKEYQKQLCSYNNETLTLNALRCRLKRKGIDHPTLEAKKYLIER